MHKYTHKKKKKKKKKKIKMPVQSAEVQAGTEQFLHAVSTVDRNCSHLMLCSVTANHR